MELTPVQQWFCRNINLLTCIIHVLTTKEHPYGLKGQFISDRGHWPPFTAKCCCSCKLMIFIVSYDIIHMFTYNVMYQEFIIQVVSVRI